MEVTTKYNIGEKVYFLNAVNGKGIITEAVITEISIKVLGSNQEIKYILDTANGDSIVLLENEVFWGIFTLTEQLRKDAKRFPVEETSQQTID